MALAAFVLLALGLDRPQAVADSTVVGSGFFVTSDGYFVTNYHVVTGATKIQVRDATGTVRTALVVAQDPANDLAILKVDGAGFEALPVANSRTAKAGTHVVTMGFPLPDLQGQEPKITEGIVNSTTGLRGDPRAFQISVSLQPGNSGGPLVDMNGNVVGVVTSKLNAVKVFKETGDIPQNVNYAIKSNYLLEVMPGVQGLETKAPPPRQKPFPDLEHLAQVLARSVGMVIAEGAEVAEAAPAPTVFPKIWRSLTSGEQFSVRLDEPYLQWVLLSGTNPGVVSAQGEAKRNGASFSGRGYKTVRNPSTLQSCAVPAQLTFSVVTPRRIEGEVVASGGGNFSYDTCRFAEEESVRRFPFVWVPQ